jgi:hypothetical protein
MSRRHDEKTLRIASPRSTTVWSLDRSQKKSADERTARGPRRQKMRRASVREGYKSVRNWMCVSWRWVSSQL